MSGYDVAIQIGGPLTDAEAGRRLVVAILDSGFSNDWSTGWEEPAEVIAVLEDAGLSENHVVLVKNEAAYLEEEPLISLCRELGLSYRVSAGAPGQDGYDTQRLWIPGMLEEVKTFPDQTEQNLYVEELELAIASAKASGDYAALDDLVMRKKTDHETKLVFQPADGILVRLETLSEEELREPLADAAGPGL
jgi:hypothetical protein